MRGFRGISCPMPQECGTSAEAAQVTSSIINMSRRRWEGKPAAEVCPPFPLLRLRPELRREVLKFVVSVSANHGARFFVRQANESHPRDLTEYQPLEATDHARGGSGTCTHWSTAACVSTVIHHTRTTPFVCKALRADVEALQRPQSPLATPRVWLSHLYELPTAAVRDMSGQEVLRELRKRSIVGRRANLVAELQCRYGKVFETCGWNRGKENEDRPRNSYELVADCPRTWSAQRTEAARKCTHTAKHYMHRDWNSKSQSWAVSRIRTNEERHAVAPVDAPLLRSLATTAFDSLCSSISYNTWTLHAMVVVLNYERGEGEPRPTPETLDTVGRRINAFFGAATVAQRPWIKEWTNKLNNNEAMSWKMYEDECKYWVGHEEDSEDGYEGELEQYHDSTRSPLTRWQDVFTTIVGPEFTGDTCMQLADDQVDLGSVAKICATFEAAYGAWEDLSEKDMKDRRFFELSSAWCHGTPTPDPNTDYTMWLGTCQKEGSYLNRGELWIKWAELPGFTLRMTIGIPSLS